MNKMLRQIKKQSFLLIMVCLLLLVYIIACYNMNSKRAYASDGKQKNESLQSSNIDYDCQANYVGMSEIDSYRLPNNDKIEYLRNNVSRVQSPKEEIIESILSYDTFQIEAEITTNNQTYRANDFYDFSKYSKFDIAEWSYNIGIISELEKIECMCDLIINGNYQNIYCLNNVLYEIRNYANRNRRL